MDRTGDEGEGHADLKASADERGPPQQAHPLDREFEADLEEQEDNAEFRELTNSLGITEKPEGAGAGDGAHDEEAHDRGQAEAFRRRESRRGEGEQKHRFDQAVGHFQAGLLPFRF